MPTFAEELNISAAEMMSISEKLKEAQEYFSKNMPGGSTNSVLEDDKFVVINE